MKAQQCGFEGSLLEVVLRNLCLQGQLMLEVNEFLFYHKQFRPLKEQSRKISYESLLRNLLFSRGNIFGLQNSSEQEFGTCN